MTEILKSIYAHSDPKYAEFISKLIPNLPKDCFIGVRTPEYRKILRELKDCAELDDFLEALPHTYYEENVLHSSLLCGIRDFDRCMEKVERFLPYVDNWAVCDGLNPAVFKTHHAELKEKIPGWIASDEPFTKRFGMHILMGHFLDGDFDPAMLEQPAALRSEEYYVNMMTAWLFAEALAKQWDTAIVYLENRRLDKWTHNKAIQKGIESLKLTDEQKTYLRSLRI